MEKLEILEVLNDWNYWNRDLPKTISRDYYDKKINSFIENDEIVVLKGIRRCGKSTLLLNQIKILCEEGIDKNDILSIKMYSPNDEEYKLAVENIKIIAIKNKRVVGFFVIELRKDVKLPKIFAAMT